MKKFKFLNGMSALFALAVVAVATIFTSCEKEEFNVNVTPANAQATISPIVLYVEADKTTDVTALATITPATLTFTGNPNLAAQKVTVSATYNSINASVEVAVPALNAGQFATITPTIILQAPVVPDPEDPTTTITIAAKASESTATVAGNSSYMDNPSDYYWTTTATYTKRTGCEDATITWDESKLNYTEVAYVNAFLSTLKNTYKTEEVVIKDVLVYAHSRTIVSVSYEIQTTTYEIEKTTTVTRAEETKETLATIVVKNYLNTVATVDIDNEIPGHGNTIPGHGHAPSHTGHGHGHGDSENAGGGIIVAD
ncbi:MAG: DUF3869 domain-containing protein [Bacteroides sp.]|nr:DUF3869 domain-containing protein [Bacteroides sp.]